MKLWILDVVLLELISNLWFSQLIILIVYFLFLMTIRLLLNLLLISFLQKTTKPNLPQSFPKSFSTFSYNILLHSLTKVYLCPFTYSHTIFPQSTNFPYNPTHSLHTLDLHHQFQINTSQPSSHDISEKWIYHGIFQRYIPLLGGKEWDGWLRWVWFEMEGWDLKHVLK
jgi:hypothetical protein